MTHPFTPTYIAMAKAAEEIQAMRPAIPESNGFDPHPCSDLGSFFIDPSNALHILHWDNDEDRWIIGNYNDDESEWPWLPRLDQLLGMLDGPCSFVHAIAHAGDGPGIYFINEADEQRDWHELALAVVMKEKYGKTWRDGKWEKA